MNVKVLVKKKIFPAPFTTFEQYCYRNCFCIENLKLIFWKTGKRVKNILIDLSPFFLSCFRTNFVRTFQSHFYNFSNCQTLLPLKHLCLLSFEYKACKLQVAILFYSISPKEVNISSMIIPERRYIYFFSILQDVQTALEHSIAGCWCSRFLFSLFAGFIFQFLLVILFIFFAMLSAKIV